MLDLNCEWCDAGIDVLGGCERGVKDWIEEREASQQLEQPEIEEETGCTELMRERVDGNSY